MIRVLTALAFALFACIPISSMAVVPLAGDWDGNGTSTVGVYFPSDGTFALSNANASGAASLFFGYGPIDPTWIPVTGDWDGNGTHTPGLYDPASGTFYLKNSNAPGPADTVFVYGPGGALLPIVGDWDGNGTYTPGLYDPASGAFFLRNSSTAGAADVTFTFGAGGPNVLPIVGDWNGDGTTTAGLYDRATSTFFLKNTNGGGLADIAFSYGAPSPDYLPIAGNWDSAGGFSVGLYEEVTGAFFLRNSNSPGNADLAFNFGPGTNAAPVLAGIEAGALSYTEGDAPTAITASLTATDDGPTLASATVQLTANCTPAEDVLAFTNQNGISGVYTAGSCTMALSGSSSVANYQAALRSVTYSNSSNNPSTLQRTASFQVNDGAVASNVLTRAITVVATNNGPVLSAGGTLSYTENDPAAVVDGGVTVTDADSTNLASATVQITANCSSPQDVLSFSNQNGITGSYTPGTCTHDADRQRHPRQLSDGAAQRPLQQYSARIPPRLRARSPGSATTAATRAHRSPAPSTSRRSTTHRRSTASGTLAYTENQAAASPSTAAIT